MNIVAVIVTYHPDSSVLKNLLNGIKHQVNSVVLVDNGSDLELKNWLDQYHAQAIHNIFLGANTGVATAQNVGIDWARQHGADYVVLFDQDSLPAADMIQLLCEAIQLKQAEGQRVAAVGPQYIDERNRERPSFAHLTGLGVKKVRCENESQIVMSDFVISSGSLIPVSTLDKVGGMIDGFFIDQIDIEWCLRAKSFGYQSYGVCAGKMRHSLGEDPIIFFGMKLLHHGPLRHYYIFRNAVSLIFKPYISLGWKLLFVRTLFLRFVFYTLMVTPRMSHLKMMAIGIWHGLRGRVGAFN